MKLNKVFTDIDHQVIKGNLELDVQDIIIDSRKVTANTMFIALPGSEVNGHDYITSAIKNGANSILVSEDVDIKEDVTVIKVPNTRKILSKLSMRFFNYPQSKLKTIAITGTKGKTTTSFMIKNILETSGYACGVIGTTGIYIKEKFYPQKNTTPESYDIFKYLNEMVNDQLDFVVMEVSSQALKYDRVNDFIFDYGIFTNLTPDHIGEHEHSDMDDYIKSKAKLFNQCNYGIFNIDDEHFYDMISGGDASIHTYGYHEKADLKAESMELTRDGSFIGINLTTSGLINDNFKISTPGKFSSYNAMAAILTCQLIGIDTSLMKKALNNFSVKGRVEPIKVSDDFSLLIDYAHNGISTESILTTIRDYQPKRIVTIFGCGGNRSKERRYEMGKIASKYSDACIITEDNNRYEDFNDIATDILKEYDKSCPYTIIPDRKAAIKYAIQTGQKGDIIMLLGKGHEDYKEIKGVRYPFDERIIIKEILEELNNSNN